MREGHEVSRRQIRGVSGAPPRAGGVHFAPMDGETEPIESRRARVGAMLVGSLRRSAKLAETSLEPVDAPASRREAVRSARRELKAVRALAPLCRCGRGDRANDLAIEGLLEFAAKANQLLGPLRDRDALARSIQRIVDRFADSGTRKVARTVLLATLIFSEGDRRDDSVYAQATIDRARRSLRAARSATARLSEGGAFDATHAGALLCRTFRACGDELAAALESGDLARLHECRKKATFLALSLRPFEDDASAPVRRLRTRAKRLAAALGEDRDLALLDVEMTAVRAQLSGSPLASAIDDALRLARLESGARVERAAEDFLRLRRGRVRRAIGELLGA